MSSAATLIAECDSSVLAQWREKGIGYAADVVEAYQTQLDLIAKQVALYEMSYSDLLGPSVESFMVCIANVLEYGHPAGGDAAANRSAQRGEERRPDVNGLEDIEAREIRKGDDLFGAGLVTSSVWVGGSIQVAAGGTTMTFWPDEIVTVRRV